MGPNLVHFRGVFYLYRGLRTTQKPYFGLILEFWIIFLIFCEWIILLNILASFKWIIFLEWIFQILFWIEFWIESFFGPIHCENDFSQCIKQGYSHNNLFKIISEGLIFPSQMVNAFVFITSSEVMSSCNNAKT